MKGVALIVAGPLRPVAGGGGGGPVVPGVDNYLRPASTDKYLRPDGTSLFKRPA